MATIPPQQTGAPYQPKKKTNVVLLVVLGLCLASCLCVGIVGAILFPVFAQAKEAAILTVCGSNMGQVGDAVSRYAAEKGKFPSSLTEAQAYAATNPTNLKCPKLERFIFGLGYAYNAATYAGKDPNKTPQSTYEKQPLLVEALAAGQDATLDPISKFPKRHMNGRYVNVYYFNRGVVRIKLTDAQIEAPIVSALPNLTPAPASRRISD